MASLQLQVVTPEKLVVDTQVDYVGVPGSEGEFGIMAGHIPLLSALATGKLHYKLNGKTENVFLSGGFAEVSDNKVTILAKVAELAENIDFARAEKARQRAEERLASKQENIDQHRAALALQRAIMRLNLRR